MSSLQSPGRAARTLRALLSVYRAWSRTRLPRCRFVPTCSAYADEAIARHGAARGMALAVRRIARCRPGGGFGVDPVPDAAPAHESRQEMSESREQHKPYLDEEMTRVG